MACQLSSGKAKHCRPEQFMQHREMTLRNWSDEMLAPAHCRYSLLASDASFRRYFRVECDRDRSFVLMDSPPDKENPTDFIKITQRLLQHGIRVPHIYHAETQHGFLLLEDFGDKLYLNQLNQNNADELYHAAIDTLIDIQQAEYQGLSAFDSNTIMAEIHLFCDWLLDKHLGLTPNTKIRKIYEDSFQVLTKNALSQPQRFMHRDYHSRNLLVLECGDTPGVLDYQDAVVGPISYDLVSLLKDCYIAWPQKDIQRWIRYFLERHYEKTGQKINEVNFVRWFDLVGIQRHLKASGIFARLYHRDCKDGYLADIPRTIGYIIDCASRYSELADLAHQMKEVQQRVLEKQQ